MQTNSAHKILSTQLIQQLLQSTHWINNNNNNNPNTNTNANQYTNNINMNMRNERIMHYLYDKKIERIMIKKI